MMMSDDAKKKASMIMISIGKGDIPMKNEKDGAEGEYMDTILEDAAAEFMDAMKMEDPKEVAYALKNFISACKYSGDDD